MGAEERIYGGRDPIPTNRFIPSEEYGLLKPYLIAVAPILDPHIPLSFGKHLGELLRKNGLRVRQLRSSSDVERTTIWRLINGKDDKYRDPKLTTAAILLATLDLEDSQVYQITMDAVPPGIKFNSIRFVFAEDTPCLRGTVQQQLWGYRKARSLSQSSLARETGVYHSSISRMESRRRIRIPHLTTFAASVYVLGLNERQVGNLYQSVSPSYR